jgi:hypothetical protein
VKFGDNLLLLHSAASLDKLRVHVPALDFYDRQAIRPCLRWISRGVQCSPTEIDIHMDFNWISTNWCPNNDYGSFPDLGSTSSRLTRLLLHGVNLDGSFAEQLRSGYPVLEDLSLVKCFCFFSEIVSGRLKHLTLDGCIVEKQFAELVITTPKLTSLRASFNAIYYPNGIHVIGTPSFVKASICVTSLYRINNIFWKKLCNIFNVRHLELFGAEMMVKSL